ncbi:hypothetical protein Pdca_34280 [Pseudonocardia autotrophica]|nr:hypothetical protein Pdca_34280 [Pseudonocardia autotrophica]
MALLLDRPSTSAAITEASGPAEPPELLTARHPSAVPSQDPDPCEPRVRSSSVPEAALRTVPSQTVPAAQSSAAPDADAADAPFCCAFGVCDGSPDRLRAAPGPVEATEVVCGEQPPPVPEHDADPVVVLGLPVAGSWLVAVLVAVPEQRVPAAQSTRAEEVDVADGPVPGFCPSRVRSGPEEPCERVWAWQPPPVTVQVAPPVLDFARPPSTSASAPETVLVTFPEHVPAPSAQSAVPVTSEVLASPAGMSPVAARAPVCAVEVLSHVPPVVVQVPDPVAVLSVAAVMVPVSGSVTRSPEPALRVEEVPLPVQPVVPAEQSTLDDDRLPVSPSVSPVPRPANPVPGVPSGVEASEELPAVHRPASAVQSAAPEVVRTTGAVIAFVFAAPVVAPVPAASAAAAVLPVPVAGVVVSVVTGRSPAARVVLRPVPVQPSRPSQSTTASAWLRPGRSVPANPYRSWEPGPPGSDALRAWQPPPVTSHRAVPAVAPSAGVTAACVCAACVCAPVPVVPVSGVVPVVAACGVVAVEVSTSPPVSTEACPVQPRSVAHSTAPFARAGVHPSPGDAVSRSPQPAAPAVHDADADAVRSCSDTAAGPVPARSAETWPVQPAPVQPASAPRSPTVDPSRQSPFAVSQDAFAVVVAFSLPGLVVGRSPVVLVAQRGSEPVRVHDADAVFAPFPAVTPQEETPASARQSSVSRCSAARPSPNALWYPAVRTRSSRPAPVPGSPGSAASPGARAAQEPNAPLVVQPAAASPSRSTPVSWPEAAASRSVAS